MGKRPGPLTGGESPGYGKSPTVSHGLKGFSCSGAACGASGSGMGRFPFQGVSLQSHAKSFLSRCRKACDAILQRYLTATVSRKAVLSTKRKFIARGERIWSKCQGGSGIFPAPPFWETPDTIMSEFVFFHGDGPDFGISPVSGPPWGSGGGYSSRPPLMRFQYFRCRASCSGESSGMNSELARTSLGMMKLPLATSSGSSSATAA